MNAAHLQLIPRVSEKTYAQSQQNTYVFNVATTANKQQIAAAVAEQFGVTVLGVTTIVQKGKKVRSVRSGKPVHGTRKDIKKAYVRLKDGDKIAVFDDKEGEKK